ncbi:MAG: cell envelope integrity protein CreD [Verrucomicrobia bacterium]|nr:cell envelope integrity protein CreD [Verrucomicrobiota bacterium]
MAGMNTSSLVSEGRTWFQRRALFFKIIGVALLGLLLLIPLGMVDSTLSERQSRYREAVVDVTATWGGSQRVAGPVLLIPYTYRADVEETRFVNGQPVKELRERIMRGEAVFLPEQLDVQGQVDPSLRRRGIYTTPVYAARLKLSGKFAAPTFEFITGRNVQPLWEQARVSFMISDLRGTRENLVLRWGTDDVPLQPGARFCDMGTGVYAPVKQAAGESREFALELTLNGSDGLQFVPLGRQTNVKIRSAWADPSFGGAYLPIAREVGPQGFNAEWQVSYYGRSFSQAWGTTGSGNVAPSAKELGESAFGVSLMQPVNMYRTIERAIKYGVLFITLVFTTFFLFEAVCGVRLSAFNYLLVGCALCLFYLGALALVELVRFALAYALAAGASTLLVALYSWHILHSGRRAWLVGGMLGGVYGYLYFVLQMEDFALLAGTGALFAVLAAVMYATRKLNAGSAKPENEEAGA